MSDTLAGARKIKYRPRRLERAAECSFCGAELAATQTLTARTGSLRWSVCIDCSYVSGVLANAAGNLAVAEHLALNPADFVR